MTEKTSAAKTELKPRDKDRGAVAEDPSAAKPHTELRTAGKGPKPRSKVIPEELRDDDDDLFNDMPV
jgi:hypothetical protein